MKDKKKLGIVGITIFLFLAPINTFALDDETPFIAEIVPSVGHQGTEFTYRHWDCDLGAYDGQFALKFYPHGNNPYLYGVNATITSYSDCTITAIVPYDSEIGTNYVFLYEPDLEQTWDDLISLGMFNVLEQKVLGAAPSHSRVERPVSITGVGTSCSVTEYSDGASVISCPDGTSATVYDGEPGTCECSTSPPFITHDAPTSVYTNPTISINVSITDDQELAYYAIQDEQEPTNNKMEVLDPTVANTSFVLDKVLVEGANKVIIMASDMEGNITKSLIDINAELSSCIPIGDQCDFLTEMNCCGYPDTVCISGICTAF